MVAYRVDVMLEVSGHKFNAYMLIEPEREWNELTRSEWWSIRTDNNRHGYGLENISSSGLLRSFALKALECLFQIMYSEPVAYLLVCDTCVNVRETEKTKCTIYFYESCVCLLQWRSLEAEVLTLRDANQTLRRKAREVSIIGFFQRCLCKDLKK